MFRRVALALGCFLALGGLASAAVVVTNPTTPYANSFDFLAKQNSNAWHDDGPSPGVPTSGSTGVYWQTNQASTTYETGTPLSAAAYALGADVNSERAMGNFGGSANPYTAWGVVFQNNSGQTITGVTVTYTGEEWRRATFVDSIRFSYKVSAAEVTNFQPSLLATPAGWTANTALTFNATNLGPPAFSDPTLALSTVLTATLPVTWLNGQFLALRWYDGDDNVSLNDAAMGIDDLNVSFLTTAVPEAPPYLFGALACLAGTLAANLARRFR